jgi:hypothetical protein
MKKLVLGIFALVFCLSSFKGVAQELGSDLKLNIVNHSMAEIIKTLSTVYVPDMSKEDFTKKMGFSKDLLEINEGKDFVDQLYTYCSKGATSDDVLRGDNSSLIKLVETIIKGGSTGPTNPNPNSNLAKIPWWKKVIKAIIKVVAILVNANNPDLPSGTVNAAEDVIDTILGD